ncbi:MAG: hypothetical protein ACK4U0_19175 [Mesorhizobium sp.]
MRALLLLISTVAAAHAGEVEIKIENFRVDHGIAEAVMKVTNRTDQPASWLFVDCVFLDADQKAIDIGKEIIRNLPVDGVVYGKAAITRAPHAQFVHCYVSNRD